MTLDTVRAHLPHRVKDAPHLTVCACGEVFRAVPGESTGTEVWAVHLAEIIDADRSTWAPTSSDAQQAAGGPQ